MEKYRASLEGKNFLIETETGDELRGFFATRWIKASSPEEAEKRAIELVRQDKSLRSVTRNIGRMEIKPKVYLEQLSTAGWWEFFRRAPGAGYTFYSMAKENE